jgi:hypothetical protein
MLGIVLNAQTVLISRVGGLYLFRDPDTLKMEIVRCERATNLDPTRYIYFTRDSCPRQFNGDPLFYFEVIQHIRTRWGLGAIHTRDEFARMFLMGDYRLY